MTKAIVGEKEFFRFLSKNLPENIKYGYHYGVSNYGTRNLDPTNFYLIEVRDQSIKRLLGFGEKIVSSTKHIAELTKFPGCKADETRGPRKSDQQMLHIIVMDDKYDDVLLDLADAFEDTFGLEAEIEDSPLLLAKLKAKREKENPSELL